MLVLIVKYVTHHNWALILPLGLLQRMNMMLSGFGWKRINHMSVLSARNTLW
jgi:hypothetical protein